MKFFLLLLLAILLNVFFSSLAYANVVWPSLYLAGRTITWAPILIGLTVEYFFIRRFTDFETKKAVIAVITMNAISALVGIYPIAFSNLYWEKYIGEHIATLSTGSFTPTAWAITLFVAVLINTLIEGLVLLWGFKLKNWKKVFIWLACANSISILVAYLTIYIDPPY